VRRFLTWLDGWREVGPSQPDGLAWLLGATLGVFLVGLVLAEVL